MHDNNNRLNNRLNEMLAGYVDGELSDSERAEFEKELENNRQLQTELKEMQMIKDKTSLLTYDDLPDEVWQNYWESLYRKTERGLGWVFFSVGAIVLASFGMIQFFKDIFSDNAIPLYLKAAVVLLSVGLAILLVSVGRESLFAYKRDRYKEVSK